MNSMTAFARTETLFDWGKVTWELRTVNQRYLETYLRIPDAYKFIEMDARQVIKKALSRGKVEGGLMIELQGDAEAFRLNEPLVENLTHAIEAIQQRLPEATQVNPVDILKWPGVLQNQDFGLDEETLSDELLSALQKTLAHLNTSRQREGAALTLVIRDKLAQMTRHIDLLKQRFPELLAKQNQVLRQRIEDLAQQVDEQRFLQELAILAQKADITEELERLETHIAEVARLIETDEVVGRRLDFLMQELNREANTLGSKSIDTLLSQTSVELKVLIEQIREQVQNIE
ncbi:MAG: YicC/YloC family endoribonuclease [Hydrogenovibrio sp.]|nr:YicC/YloC family endoribonuclease [Hydrogenovibrio sp.]